MDRTKKLQEIAHNLNEIRDGLARCAAGAQEHKDKIDDDGLNAFAMATEEMLAAAQQLERGIEQAKAKAQPEKVA